MHSALIDLLHSSDASGYQSLPEPMKPLLSFEEEDRGRTGLGLGGDNLTRGSSWGISFQLSACLCLTLLLPEAKYGKRDLAILRETHS